MMKLEEEEEHRVYVNFNGLLECHVSAISAFGNFRF